MQISVVVTICQMLGTISQPICREEIITKGEMSMLACNINQPALADWKAHSIFRSDQWKIAGYKCVPGEYVIKDAI